MFHKLLDQGRLELRLRRTEQQSEMNALAPDNGEGDLVDIFEINEDVVNCHRITGRFRFA